MMRKLKSAENAILFVLSEPDIFKNVPLLFVCFRYGAWELHDTWKTLPKSLLGPDGSPIVSFFFGRSSTPASPSGHVTAGTPGESGAAARPADRSGDILPDVFPELGLAVSELLRLQAAAAHADGTDQFADASLAVDMGVRSKLCTPLALFFAHGVRAPKMKFRRRGLFDPLAEFAKLESARDPTVLRVSRLVRTMLENPDLRSFEKGTS